MFHKLYFRNIFKKWFNDDIFSDEKQTEILQSLFFYMRILHVCPKKGQTLKKTDIFLFLMVAFPLTPILVFAEIIHVFATQRNYLLNDILSGAALVGTSSNVYILLGIFIKHNESIQQLVQNVGDFRRFPKPQNFHKINKRLNIISHIIVFYGAIAVCSYGVFGLIDRSACLQENYELNLGRICGMVAPALMPSSFNHNPKFWIGFINQLYASTISCVAAMLGAFVLVGTTEMLITRIRDFKHVIQQAFLFEDAKVQKEYLKYCVRYHCYIIELVNELNENLSYAAFVLSSFSSAIIALTSFQFMINPETKTLMHCCAWILMLMLFSASGQRLIDESSQISSMIYSTDWFTGNVEAQKFVHMIILRGNHHMYISTYFGKTSFETFTAVMTNAYSFLTLLFQMDK